MFYTLNMGFLQIRARAGSYLVLPHKEACPEAYRIDFCKIFVFIECVTEL